MGAVLDLVRVLFEPAKVFERVREKPTFFVPVVAIIVVSIGVGALSLPYIKAALAPVLAKAAAARGGAAPDPGKIAASQIVASAVFVPIFLALSAGFLWVSVSLFGEDAKYRLLLSVVTFSAVTYLLQLVASFAVLSLRGVESITSPADLQPAFGLDLLAPATTGYAGSLLRSVNLFSVWGAGLNGIGIATTHRTSKTTGYGAAAVAFVMIVLLLSLLALLQPQA